MTTPRLDRRAFLAAAGLATLTGCGATTRKSHRRPQRIPNPGPVRLRDAIRGRVIEAGSPGFAQASHVYNTRFDPVLPGAVARPQDAEDVVRAVRWAVSRGVPIRARSGGHSYAGYSTLEGGVVLDLRELRSIHVDRRTGRARVGPGAQLIDAYRQLAAHGATIPAGTCPSVGIGGTTLGGGMGLAGRAYGLTLDHLVAAEIVTADGSLRTVDPEADPDLLWALRGGGGGNFGVVTGLTFELRPLPAAASFFFLSWPWAGAGEVIEAWLTWAPHTDERLTSVMHLAAVGGALSIGVSGQFIGPAGELAGSKLAPLQAVPGGQLTTGDGSYLALQERWAGCLHLPAAACHTVRTAPGGTLPRAGFYAKSDYLDRPLPAAARTGLLSALEGRASLPGGAAFLFDAYGGAINRIAPAATAFVHRQMLCSVQYLDYSGGEEWLERAWERMRPYASGMAYQNYIDPSLRGWREAYYGENLPRLEAIRREVDPHHFFRFPQAI